jgi:hypothetical protein
MWVQSKLGYHNRNHEVHRIVLCLKAKSCFEMWNNERIPRIFNHSTKKCCKTWKQLIKQNLDVLLKHKPWRNARFQDIFRMIVSHLECEIFGKNIKKCCFLRSTSPIFPPKPLECRIFINKINIIVLINVVLLMKKIPDSNTNFKKLVFYITEILCHHVEHTLFYLWLKYESIWKNIIIPVDSFSIKLCSGTTLLKRVLGYIRTCSNHPNYKQAQPF